MRYWAFIGKGYGCYENFDVREDSNFSQMSPREVAILFGRPFDPNYEADNECLKEAAWFKDKSGIEFGWWWDGDGTLAFVIPEVGILRNSDCKKDHDWEFESSEADLLPVRKK